MRSGGSRRCWRWSSGPSSRRWCAEIPARHCLSLRFRCPLPLPKTVAFACGAADDSSKPLPLLVVLQADPTIHCATVLRWSVHSTTQPWNGIPAFHCLSLAFHCLALAFRCLALTFHNSNESHGVEQPTLLR